MGGKLRVLDQPVPVPAPTSCHASGGHPTDADLLALLEGC